MKLISKFILINLLLLSNKNLFSAELDAFQLYFDKKEFMENMQARNNEHSKEMRKFSLFNLNQVIKHEISLDEAIFGINAQIEECEANIKNIDEKIRSELQRLRTKKPGLIFSYEERRQIKELSLKRFQSDLIILKERKLFLEKLKDNGDHAFVQLFLNGKLTVELINMRESNSDFDKEIIKMYYLLKELYGKKCDACQRISESCVIL